MKKIARESITRSEMIGAMRWFGKVLHYYGYGKCFIAGKIFITSSILGVYMCVCVCW